MSTALRDYLNYEAGRAASDIETKKLNKIKEKEKEILDELPAFNELRDVISNANVFVVDLEKCSDNFRQVIESIKDNLKKANLLILALEKAQRDTVLKILDVDWSDAAIQADPILSIFGQNPKGTQTADINEILLQLLIESKQLPAATDATEIRPAEIHDSALSNDYVVAKTDQPNSSLTKKFEEVSETEEIVYVIPKKNKQRSLFTNIMRITVIISILINCLLFAAAYHGVGMLAEIIDLEERTRFALINFVPSCKGEPTIENGNVVCESIVQQVASRFPRRQLICQFTCNNGFAVTPKNGAMVRCSISRRWNASFPSCTQLSCPELPSHDCASLYRLGGRRRSGVYRITPCGSAGSYRVFCDFTFVGGGWTAVQRRLDGQTNFDRNFSTFENYFGNSRGSYWLGLNMLNFYTTYEPQSLLVVLTDWYNPSYHRSKAYAWYRKFAVDGPQTNYRLRISDYSFLAVGLQLAGDSMRESNGMQFTAKNADHDQTLLRNCAIEMKSAWWHRNCTSANLNAEYLNQPTVNKRTIHWKSWRGLSSLRRAEMYIRPLNYMKGLG